jgi:hypothetical protein
MKDRNRLPFVPIFFHSKSQCKLTFICE